MNKKTLKEIGFSHQRYLFSEGIPKILDILKNPEKVPRLSTDGCIGDRPIEIMSSIPLSRSDYLTVENFKQGLEKVQEEYKERNANDQEKRRISASFGFRDTGPISNRSGSDFFSSYLSWGGFCYSLTLTQEGKDKGSPVYVAHLKKEIPKFEQIMDACSGPNQLNLKYY